MFRFTEDNIVFIVTVVDFSAQTKSVSEETALLTEAQNLFRKGKKVLADEQVRVDAYIGRRITVDLPDCCGRSASAFYYKHGHLIELVATVPPENGDYNSSELGRFVESLSFQESRVNPQATEVPIMGF